MEGIGTSTTSFKKLAKLLRVDINKFKLMCKSLLDTWIVIYTGIYKFREYHDFCFRQQRHISPKTEANLSQKTSENLFFMFCIVTKAKSLKFDEG